MTLKKPKRAKNGKPRNAPIPEDAPSAAADDLVIEASTDQMRRFDDNDKRSGHLRNDG